jgi:hypothetical protein
MRKVLLFALIVVLSLAMFAPVFADPPDVPEPNENNSPGKSFGKGNSQAGGHCENTWGNTPLAGETGSDQDEKQGGSLGSGGDTGVGNCDQWWNWAGAGSNGPENPEP